MKKEISKKVLVLSLVLLSLIIINFVLVAAQTADTTSDSEPGYFQRWASGTLKDTQAKFLLFIMMFALLFVLIYSLSDSQPAAWLISIPAAFILVAYVTPASIIGIFKSYDTLPLAVATFLPLAILFGVTYLAIIKGKAIMVTGQWLLWVIYTVYGFIKLAVSVYVYNMGPTDTWSTYLMGAVALPQNLGSSEAFWFWASTIVTFLIAVGMTFFSGKIVRWAMKQTVELTNDVAKKHIDESVNFLKATAEAERKMAK